MTTPTSKGPPFANRPFLRFFVLIIAVFVLIFGIAGFVDSGQRSVFHWGSFLLGVATFVCLGLGMIDPRRFHWGVKFAAVSFAVTTCLWAATLIIGPGNSKYANSLEAARAGDFKATKEAELRYIRDQKMDEVIELWTVYIEAMPDDPRGYHERGGAYSQLRDRRAIADAKTACKMGYQPSCDALSKIH